MTEETIALAEATLQKADPLLGTLIASQKLALPTPRTDYFTSLVRSIIGQQVSVAAARAIALRFETHTNMEPEKVVAMTDDEAKTIGLSRQKTAYIRDLAGHFAADPGIYNHLDTLSDEDIIIELTAVKGIGVWTAQMFLMFTLARPDVFAPDDVGLQHAMMRLYGWTTLPPKKELNTVASVWHPYRTIASFHLWQSLKNTPT